MLLFIKGDFVPFSAVIKYNKCIRQIKPEILSIFWYIFRNSWINPL